MFAATLAGCAFTFTPFYNTIFDPYNSFFFIADAIRPLQKYAPLNVPTIFFPLYCHESIHNPLCLSAALKCMTKSECVVATLY